MGGNVLCKEQRAALPPYATQLLNAGCRVTSIQKFLGHKDLKTTMIYAHAHDQTVAEDYFAAMERVERRLEIAPVGEKEPDEKYENVKVLEKTYLFELTEKLAQLVLGDEERFALVEQLREALGVLNVKIV